MTDFFTEIEAEAEHVLHPAPVPSVPVTLAGQVATAAAEYGSYLSISLTGTEAPRVILPYDHHRYECFLQVPATVAPGASVIAVSNAFAAGAAVQAFLPSAAYVLTGFSVTCGNATSPGVATVSGVNVNGGTYSLFESATAGTQLNINFPSPLASTGGSPAVGIGALASGASGTITVYGQLAGSGNPGVWVGTEAQVKATPVLGWFLTAGTILPVRHRQPVWVMGNGSPATLNVAIARHSSGLAS
jgi:hypothetical protein